MRRPFVVAAIVSAALSTGVIAYAASTGSFDPSGRVISDNLEGMDTQQAENPAFPQSNLSAVEENMTSSS